MATAKKTSRKKVKRKLPTNWAINPKVRYKSLGELHDLLERAFPDHRRPTFDILDIAWLSKQLRVTDEAIYTWCRNNTLQMKRARQIVEIEGCRISLKALLPFVL